MDTVEIFRTRPTYRCSKVGNSPVPSTITHWSEYSGRWKSNDLGRRESQDHNDLESSGSVRLVRKNELKGDKEMDYTRQRKRQIKGEGSILHSQKLESTSNLSEPFVNVKVYAPSVWSGFVAILVLETSILGP